MLEPDVCIYPAGMRNTDVRGADILLAVEVSDNSLRYDLGKNARRYAAHGGAITGFSIWRPKPCNVIRDRGRKGTSK